MNIRRALFSNFCITFHIIALFNVYWEANADSNGCCKLGVVPEEEEVKHCVEVKEKVDACQLKCDDQWNPEKNVAEAVCNCQKSCKDSKDTTCIKGCLNMEGCEDSFLGSSFAECLRDNSKAALSWIWIVIVLLVLIIIAAIVAVAVFVWWQRQRRMKTTVMHPGLQQQPMAVQAHPAATVGGPQPMVASPYPPQPMGMAPQPMGMAPQPMGMAPHPY